MAPYSYRVTKTKSKLILFLTLTSLLLSFLSNQPFSAYSEEGSVKKKSEKISLSKSLAEEAIVGKGLRESEFEALLEEADLLTKNIITLNQDYVAQLRTDLDPYTSKLIYSNDGNSLSSIERIAKDGQTVLYKEIYDYKQKASYIYSPESRLITEELSIKKGKTKGNPTMVFIKVSDEEARNFKGRFPPGMRMMLYKSGGSIPFLYSLKDNYINSKSLYKVFLGSSVGKNGILQVSRSTGKVDKSVESLEITTSNKNSSLLTIKLFFNDRYAGAVEQEIEGIPLTLAKPTLWLTFKEVLSSERLRNASKIEVNPEFNKN